MTYTSVNECTWSPVALNALWICVAQSFIVHKFQVIECSDLSGNNRRLLVTSVPHPYGLAVAGEFIYWTDWSKKALLRADKDTGNEVKVIRDQMPRLMGVSAVQMTDISE